MRNEDLSVYRRRVRRAFQDSPGSIQGFDTRGQISWGCETRRAGEDYFWEGSRRGHPSRPQVLFQYTLEGRGEYAEGGRCWSVEPGQGFTALLPSRHRYSLPKGPGSWSFFWFIVRHPYVADRVMKLREEEAALQAWRPGSAALESAVALFEAACRGKLREVWTFEHLLFSWLLESERELHDRRYPQDERQRLLDETRRLVGERLPRPVSTSELADFHHLERTTFSRKFKMTTGLAPAAFMTEVRLEEALKLLRTDAKLEDVAAETGFADANHFCKVFRRHFHSSPGAYRRLILKR